MGRACSPPFKILMKKIINYFLIAVVVVCVALLVYYGFLCADKKKSENIQSKVPSRLVKTGPYGKNVRSTEQIGNYIINMKAKNIFLAVLVNLLTQKMKILKDAHLLNTNSL